jgi:hypothetical protein
MWRLWLVVMVMLMMLLLACCPTHATTAGRCLALGSSSASATAAALASVAPFASAVVRGVIAVTLPIQRVRHSPSAPHVWRIVVAHATSVRLLLWQKGLLLCLLR